jgi:hypothetical protein
MIAGPLVRPARSWRLLLLVALFLVLVAVALVAAHALLGGVPAHALSLIRRPIGCGAVPGPC